MEYKWDKRLLRKLAKNKIVKEELHNIYYPFFNYDTEAYKYLVPLRKKMLIDAEYLKNRTYLEKPTRMISEKYVNEIFLNSEPNFFDISNDEILMYTHDFYKQFDPVIYETFLKIFNERFTHLKFEKPRLVIPTPTTFYSYTADEIFIKTCNLSNIKSILASIHEYAHAISCKMNNRELDLFSFCEIESSFPEMAALDFLENIPSFKEEINNARCEYFIYSFDGIIDLANKYTVTKCLNEVLIENKAKYFSKKLLSEVINNITFDIDDLKLLYEYRVSDTLQYQLGELVAYELYHAYQNDKQAAIELYKIILSTACVIDNEEQYLYSEELLENMNMRLLLDSGVIPGKHIDTFVRKIKRN